MSERKRESRERGSEFLKISIQFHGDPDPEERQMWKGFMKKQIFMVLFFLLSPLSRIETSSRQTIKIGS